MGSDTSEVKYISGRWLAHNRLPPLAKAYLGADLFAGNYRLVEPTQLQAALLARSTPRELYPHTKPIGLISRLIGAVTKPGDLVIDPAAGSFVVMRAAHALERDFIGCDLTHVGTDRAHTRVAFKHEIAEAVGGRAHG